MSGINSTTSNYQQPEDLSVNKNEKTLNEKKQVGPLGSTEEQSPDASAQAAVLSSYLSTNTVAMILTRPDCKDKKIEDNSNVSASTARATGHSTELQNRDDPSRDEVPSDNAVSGKANLEQ